MNENCAIPSIPFSLVYSGGNKVEPDRVTASPAAARRYLVQKNDLRENLSHTFRPTPHYCPVAPFLAVEVDKMIFMHRVFVRHRLVCMAEDSKRLTI